MHEEIYFKKIINIAKAYEGAKTLLVAYDLDIFNVLAEKPLNCLEIAKKLNLDIRATNLFLDALVGLKLLKKKKNAYYNSKHADSYLVKGKEYYIGQYLELTKKICINGKDWKKP